MSKKINKKVIKSVKKLSKKYKKQAKKSNLILIFNKYILVYYKWGGGY